VCVLGGEMSIDYVHDRNLMQGVTHT
jgi:hypothetical protein